MTYSETITDDRKLSWMLSNLMAG